ncbi:MAG: glycosyltransferase family 2 protein [Acidobacteriota bacterium]|nr:glycosyltransferase family 2 protein [Acidobacteriota bacterium]
MSELPDVSVVISTYNRCEMLPCAIESLLAQDAGRACYEIIVVDNNSTDRTREVVEAFMAQGHTNLRYFFEGRQGLSHGWNTAIKHARSQIIALMDDDTSAARDYVAKIKRAFDEHPEADFIGGKVLPHWKREPPRWLTRKHWAPLALQDYGEEPFYTNQARPLCLVNKAFRHSVFERFGFFKPELGRIKDSIGSSEDHDLQSRVWRAGGQGMYAPEVIIFAEVQEERLTKEYHRRWHTGHGRFHSIMRLEELEVGDVRLFDVPAHLYRQALKNTFGWLKHSLRGREELAFESENEVNYFRGFFRQRRKEFKAMRPRSTPREVALFLQSLLSSKLSRKDRSEFKIL